MKKENISIKFLGIIAAFLLQASCGDSNYYDSHKGQEADATQIKSGEDTMMVRAPDGSEVVIDSTNIGIGDTTPEKTPH